MPRLLPLAGWLMAGAGLAAGGLAGYTASALNGPRRPWPDYAFTPFEVGVEAEDVRFTTADGVRLAGWWLDRPDSDLVVICAHGHRGNKSDLLGIGPGLWRAGHTVLLFDFRGCGDSGDGRQSVAHHEQTDLIAAIDLVAQRRPSATIAVIGFSMGASTAILTAATDPRLEILVLDSPFATMSDVVATAYRRYRLPPGALVPLADLATRARYGYTFGQVRPLDVIATLPPRPILLLHGSLDRIIPIAHAYQLAEAAGWRPHAASHADDGSPAAADGESTELVVFNGVDHCGGYFEDRAGYIARVDAFLTAHARPQLSD